ncbi:MAG: hypothetical protein MUO82_04480, partial [Candidatus Thermoplasmatota archaeon]|nr:hypothetical protein [Candidatus Thermoplasmatota archaeon]
MDFFNGLYLGNEICAFSGDWFVVWDGKFNYMLFNSSHPTVLSRGTNGWMPRNTFERKLVEFYSNF